MDMLSIRSFHSKTPPNTPTHHIKPTHFNRKTATAQTKNEHTMLACSMYIVPRFISHYIYSAKIAPSICSRPSPNAKGAKTDTKKNPNTQKVLKSS